MRRRTPLLAAVLCAAVGAAPLQAATPAPKALVQTAIVEVMQPAYAELGERAGAMAAALSEGCEATRSRDAFVPLAQAFSRLEYYRLGAMNRDNRAERLFFWPDRKSIGQRQLRRLLADPGRATLDAEALAGKSVALQGLPALERIVYRAGADIDPADCAVARAIAANVRRIAAELQADWQLGQGTAQALLQPQPQGDYRNHTESLAALLTVAESALVAMGDKKLRALDRGLEQLGELPKSAPFWRSGQTLNNLRRNLEGVERLLFDAGLARAGGAESALRFEFANARNMLDAVAEALAAGDAAAARERLLALRYILDSLQALVGDRLAVELGVVTGFNASDGD